MGWLFRGQDETPSKGLEVGGYETLSTPFLDVGDGNLSLPYVNRFAQGQGGSIYFGADNLFPQLLVQMYYTSPLNAAIIDFKTNAVIGGGSELVLNSTDPKDKVKLYSFAKRLNLAKLERKITRELIVHERAYVLIKYKKKVNDKQEIVSLTPYNAEFISSDKVRKRTDGKFNICSDWSNGARIKTVSQINPNCQDENQLYVYENDGLGQDFYPIPSYSTCLNWCFLDGESSYFHKTNIKESIFPSFALMFPKKPANDEEKNGIKKTIEGAKGAQNAGRIITFFANKPEQLPKLEAIPTNQNDKLFLQTDERTDTKICQAHVIDPILMGIRVSGKLGSGSDIKQSYTIFEKNSIMPRRSEMEEIGNALIDIFGIPAIYSVNNYQIIGETIKEVEQPKEQTK